MFGFLKKKKKKEESEEESSEEPQETQDQNTQQQPSQMSASLEAQVGHMSAELEKLKAQFSSFYEMQKATSERFTRINEQAGELRAMIMDRDKESKMFEAKAAQAIDLVKTIQPDKFMVEMRKSDSKIEALKANLESNEAIMKNITDELREMRNKINNFRGMEQVMKLSDEVKRELMEIKKQVALVQRHGDKVETIFSEMQKKARDFEKMSDLTSDLDKSVKQLTSDMDSVKVKMGIFADKKEVENLVTKFNEFESYVGNVVSLVNRKTDKAEKELTEVISKRLEEGDKLITGFRILAQKTPDLDKYFNLLSEEAKKAPKPEKKVEKVKSPGEEEPDEAKEKAKNKETILDKIKDKLPKHEAPKK